METGICDVAEAQRRIPKLRACRSKIPLISDSTLYSIQYSDNAILNNRNIFTGGHNNSKPVRGPLFTPTATPHMTKR